MIDLHSHTTASDGEFSPAQQAAMAARAGITVLAVTDHDTVSGLEASQEACRALSLRLVPGIEVSVQLNRREVHILGHFVDPTEPRLAGFTEELRVERHARMEQMVAKVRDLGFPITMDHVLALAGDAHLTRPHLARTMVELGYCSSVKDAFDRFLGDGRQAWVPRKEVTVERAVRLIHGAGGTATVAHPGATRIHRQELEDMKRVGLDGIEVGHTDHPPSQRELLGKWAMELVLVPTSGSDFHGPTVAPTRHFGTISMTAEELAHLEHRRPARP
jgi:predicted metal-dependent phosphoesterase TrpH